MAQRDGNHFQRVRMWRRRQEETSSRLAHLSTVEWWEAKKATLGDETIKRLNGEGFKKNFLRKYFPTLEREFIDLVQGNRTVQEYTVLFEILSYFALHLVDMLEKKNKKFLCGLRTII